MEDHSSSSQQLENEQNNNVNLEEDFDNMNQLDDFQNDEQNDFDQVTPNQNIDNQGDFNVQEEKQNMIQQGNQPNQQMLTNANIQENNFFGINKTLYQNYPDGKKISQFVKTGTDFVMLPRNPEFVFETDPFETLYAPKQDILENSLRREIEKFCFADTLLNKIVYDSSDPSIFTKDVDPRNYELEVMPFYIPTSNQDKTLVFESRFESGNLRRAIQLLDFEYNLILKPDYSTQGNTQWFYFSVANTRKNQEYRFNIINMMKPDSLYNQGMKPLVYSEKFAKFQKIG